MSKNKQRPPEPLDFFIWIVEGPGKFAVLNSLIGHPALPTGEGGATRAPICIDLMRDSSISSKSIILQIDSALWHSLQDRLSKISGKSRDEIYLKLQTSTGLCRFRALVDLLNNRVVNMYVLVLSPSPVDPRCHTISIYFPYWQKKCQKKLMLKDARQVLLPEYAIGDEKQLMQVLLNVVGTL